MCSVLLLLTAVSSEATTETFSDVPEGSVHAGAITWLDDAAISTGVTAERFAPASPVMRGQMASFLWRYRSSPQLHPDLAGSTDFADVPSDGVHAEAVAWLASSDITTGTQDGLFAPTTPVTRGQMASFLWRLNGRPAPTTRTGFSDVPADSVHATAIEWLAHAGVTTGVTTQRFAPTDAVTRAQMASFLWRLADRPDVGEAGANRIRTDVVLAPAQQILGASQADEHHVEVEFGDGLRDDVEDGDKVIVPPVPELLHGFHGEVVEVTGSSARLRRVPLDAVVEDLDWVASPSTPQSRRQRQGSQTPLNATLEEREGVVTTAADEFTDQPAIATTDISKLAGRLPSATCGSEEQMAPAVSLGPNEIDLSGSQVHVGGGDNLYVDLSASVGVTGALRSGSCTAQIPTASTDVGVPDVRFPTPTPVPIIMVTVSTSLEAELQADLDAPLYFATEQRLSLVTGVRDGEFVREYQDSAEMELYSAPGGTATVRVTGFLDVALSLSGTTGFALQTGPYSEKTFRLCGSDAGASPWDYGWTVSVSFFPLEVARPFLRELETTSEAFDLPLTRRDDAVPSDVSCGTAFVPPMNEIDSIDVPMLLSADAEGAEARIGNVSGLRGTTDAVWWQSAAREDGSLPSEVQRADTTWLYRADPNEGEVTSPPLPPGVNDPRIMNWEVSRDGSTLTVVFATDGAWRFDVVTERWSQLATSSPRLVSHPRMSSTPRGHVSVFAPQICSQGPFDSEPSSLFRSATSLTTGFVTDAVQRCRPATDPLFMRDVLLHRPNGGWLVAADGQNGRGPLRLMRFDETGSTWDERAAPEDVHRLHQANAEDIIIASRRGVQQLRETVVLEPDGEARPLGNLARQRPSIADDGRVVFQDVAAGPARDLPSCGGGDAWLIADEAEISCVPWLVDDDRAVHRAVALPGGQIAVAARDAVYLFPSPDAAS